MTIIYFFIFNKTASSHLKIPTVGLKLRHGVNSMQLLAVINYGVMDC